MLATLLQPIKPAQHTTNQSVVMLCYVTHTTTCISSSALLHSQQLPLQSNQNQAAHIRQHKPTQHSTHHIPAAGKFKALYKIIYASRTAVEQTPVSANTPHTSRHQHAPTASIA
jgi:hypothetical protein